MTANSRNESFLWLRSARLHLTNRNGVRNITDYEIKAIAQVLKVSPNNLFDWKKDSAK